MINRNKKIKYSEVVFSGGTGGVSLQVEKTVFNKIYTRFKIILPEMNPYVREIGSNCIDCELQIEDLERLKSYCEKALEIYKNQCLNSESTSIN